MFTNNYMNPFGSTMPTATQPYGYPMSPYMGMGNMPQNTPAPAAPQVATNVIYVSGLEDVRQRNLPANSVGIFLDNDKPLLYQKVVDGKGQYEIKTFDLSPHIDTQSDKKTEGIDLSAYALKEQIDPLESEIKHIREDIDKLKSQHITLNPTKPI